MSSAAPNLCFQATHARARLNWSRSFAADAQTRYGTAEVWGTIEEKSHHGRRWLLALLLAVAVAAAGTWGYTYLHPFNRYRRAAMGWIQEHNDIVEVGLALVDDYHSRPAADGFTEAYREQVARRWFDLEAEVEAYEAPPQLSRSHALLLEAVHEQAAGARVLLAGPGSSEYAEHGARALLAIREFPDTFREERVAWIGK